MPDEEKRMPIAVDLGEHKRQRQDEPFFEIKRPQYPDCTHQWRGVTLDSGTRRVFCKCGEQIDPFDALLIYAHAESRLLSTREAIEEHKAKEAEKKARKPFMREVTSYFRDGAGGFSVTLVCGHKFTWQPTGWHRQPTRNLNCAQCRREKELADKGVTALKPQASEAAEGLWR